MTDLQIPASVFDAAEKAWPKVATERAMATIVTAAIREWERVRAGDGQKHTEGWIEFAHSIGQLVGCLYSVAPDGNSHITSAVKRTVADLAAAQAALADNGWYYQRKIDEATKPLHMQLEAAQAERVKANEKCAEAIQMAINEKNMYWRKVAADSALIEIEIRKQLDNALRAVEEWTKTANTIARQRDEAQANVGELERELKSREDDVSIVHHSATFAELERAEDTLRRIGFTRDGDRWTQSTVLKLSASVPRWSIAIDNRGIITTQTDPDGWWVEHHDILAWKRRADDEERRIRCAEQALESAGFTRCDGELGWKPPIGKKPLNLCAQRWDNYSDGKMRAHNLGYWLKHSDAVAWERGAELSAAPVDFIAPKELATNPRSPLSLTVQRYTVQRWGDGTLTHIHKDGGWCIYSDILAWERGETTALKDAPPCTRFQTTDEKPDTVKAVTPRAPTLSLATLEHMRDHWEMQMNACPKHSDAELACLQIVNAYKTAAFIMRGARAIEASKETK